MRICAGTSGWFQNRSSTTERLTLEHFVQSLNDTQSCIPIGNSQWAVWWKLFLSKVLFSSSQVSLDYKTWLNSFFYSCKSLNTLPYWSASVSETISEIRFHVLFSLFFYLKTIPTLRIRPMSQGTLQMYMHKGPHEVLSLVGLESTAVGEVGSGEATA